MKLNFMSTRFLRILVAAGYLLMCLLAGGIMYLWHYEWKEIEALETENQRINNFRQEIHHVYGEMTGLSLLGESVLEWEDEDLEHYHIRRMAVDSMLCRFKTVYPARQIDSVRHLLESKERLLQGIVEVLDEQESLNQRIAERVPVIAARSAQEQPQKSKRKGFLGLFGKKEKPKTTATTNMLHALNSKEIAQQQAQSRRLAAQTNSLAMRNNKLNRQLQSLIGQMDRKIESDLQGREMEITAMRERSFLQIGSLTGCLFLLLVVSYIIIHRDIRRIIPVVVATASGSCTEEELLSQGFSACLFKPFDLSELMAVSEKCLSPLLSDKEEQPDLTSLLAYGDKVAMLDKLITETEKDMQAIKEAGAMLDRKALDIQVHRLRSSWAVIRADKPLRELHRLLRMEENCADEEISKAIDAMLAMGNKIVGQAKTRKEDKQ